MVKAQEEKSPGKLSVWRHRLLRIGEEEPLSFISLIFILFLDFFVLIIIFNGLHDHARMLTRPYAYVPYRCRQIIIEKEWNRYNYLDKLGTIVLKEHRSEFYRKERKGDVHPICRTLISALDSLKKDKAAVRLFEERSCIQHEEQELRKRYNQAKKEYDTKLLEDVAASVQPGSIREKERYTRITRKQEQVRTALSVCEKSLSDLPQVVQLRDIIEDANKQFSGPLIADVRRYNFIYPIKKLAFEFLFLLPLALVFYLWNSLSLKKTRKLQVLISSHLLVVVSIPILFQLIKTVIDIIPKHILTKFIELLESLHLIAVWYYLVIVLAIGAVIVIIYIVQKKLFNKEKLQERRLKKGQCVFCGKKLPCQDNVCVFCGCAQNRICTQCGGTTYEGGRYCRQCGAPQDR